MQKISKAFRSVEDLKKLKGELLSSTIELLKITKFEFVDILSS